MAKKDNLKRSWSNEDLKQFFTQPATEKESLQQKTETALKSKEVSGKETTRAKKDIEIESR